MMDYAGDWVLLKVANGSAQKLAQKLQSKGIRTIVPSYVPSKQTAGTENLLPGHIPAEAAIDEMPGGTGPQSEWSVVTNTANRAFAIPGPIANALAGLVGSTMHQIQTSLARLSPEYRMEQLIIECTRWRGKAKERS